MPDYAEVAGVTNAYSNGQSHTSTSPLYDSCGAYATTSLIGTTNIYHQNRYENQQQAAAQYNNVIRNGPFVYPNKKTSSTSLNTPNKVDEAGDEGGNREKLNNTYGGNRTNTLSYGIRNRLMKMNITENKMDILINNLGAKGAVSQNGSIKSIQKPMAATESVIPLPPPTPNLGSTRRNQFLANGGGNHTNNSNLHVSKKNLFPNEAPLIIKSYLDPETDDEDDIGHQQSAEVMNGGGGGIRSCDRESNGGEARDAVNNSCSSINNHNNNSRSRSQQRHLLSGGDNQSLNGGGSPGKNQMPNKSNKSLNSSSAASSPYHMINHGRRNGAGSPAAMNNGGIQAAASLMLDSSASSCLNNNAGGNSASSSSGCSSASSPLMKKNFTGSDNQINGSPNYMKSFGKTDNV